MSQDEHGNDAHEGEARNPQEDMKAPSEDDEAPNLQREEEGLNGLSIFKTMAMYFIISQVFHVLLSPSVPDENVQDGNQPPNGNRPPKPIIYNQNWKQSEAFDLRVFVSENPKPDLSASGLQSDNLIWEEKGILFDWDDSNLRGVNLSLPVSSKVQRNGSIFAHVFVNRVGKDYQPTSSVFDPKDAFYVSHQLNEYKLRPRTKKVKNLLSGEKKDSDTLDEKMTDEILSWWNPKLEVRLVVDYTTFSSSNIPPTVAPHLRFHNESRTYYPIVYFDKFWSLQSQRIPINASVKTLDLELKYRPISLLKWQMQNQMEVSWKKQRESGMGSEKDSEELKRMMMETNPYLLALTAIVSIFHMIFDCLAFKSDIQFWREKKSMEGLSVRSIILNAICQVIVFLYLLDNDTSWMIVLSSGVGILIEFWKINKAVDIEIDSENFPFVIIKGKAEYTQTETAEHDRVAMEYLSYVLYPLIAAYAVYSLFYEEHKSLYSWILGSLVGSVYMFGFIMMCPQLYLNYKLKSVAHLPWRMLTYKALNTFIDDMFAFIIKMPTLHRLSCFRDDIIFFIYLYQRWIYPVDYSRVNEFGLVPKKEDDDESEVKETEEVSNSLEVSPEQSEPASPTTKLVSKDEIHAKEGECIVKKDEDCEGKSVPKPVHEVKKEVKKECNDDAEVQTPLEKSAEEPIEEPAEEPKATKPVSGLRKRNVRSDDVVDDDWVLT
mmetsp:Transcript_28550/g.69605  ORF Transcript_28550/g.69605 Transcript_28550/m.69605 type:complete len:716 (-) Transcript_28550:127-2274(-)